MAMRKMTIRSTTVVCALLGIGLSGCAAKEQKYAGFLGDYSRLSPDKQADNALTYFSPDHDLGKYDKFMIDPILVHFAPHAKGTSVDAGKLDELVDYFDAELRKALTENKYQVVQKKGPGVVRLRIALTDVRKTTAALNVHPATKLSGMGTGGAAMEAEMIDSRSGQRIAALVDARQGNRMSLGAGFKETGHAHQVVDHWIKRLMTRLNKAHGRA